MVKRADGSLRSIRSHKVVLVGESSVGKTSIIGQLRDGVFDAHYQATIGIDFGPKVIHLAPDRPVKLQLWDTAGQERFRSLIPSYLRDMAACIVVYDITNRKSFDAVKTWVEDAKRERGDDAPAGAAGGLVLYIVGNKKDLEAERVVSTAEGEQLAQSLGCFFAEVSAKSGAGVNDLFTAVAAKMPQDAQTAGNKAGGEVAINTANIAGKKPGAANTSSQCAC